MSIFLEGIWIHAIGVLLCRNAVMVVFVCPPKFTTLQREEYISMSYIIFLSSFLLFLCYTRLCPICFFFLSANNYLNAIRSSFY